MLTAEYGGTGGKDLSGGMAVEEPDIEIGAGVSSKGTALHFLQTVNLFADLLDSNQQTHGYRQRRSIRSTFHSRWPK